MVESAVQSHAEIVVGSTEKKQIRVLHVDDELGLLKIAKQCLELQGPFQVDTANSVEESLSRLKEKEYDAVVSDYQMPGKDGLQFLEMLRKDGNTIPFIMFTGKGREEVAVKAWSLGADHYVNKTGDPETVFCELAHCLRSTVEKRFAEAQMKETVQKLQTIYQNAVEGITYVDAEENIVYANKAFADIVGYEQDQLVGLSLRKIVDDENWAKIERETKRRWQGESSRYEVEFRRRDGTVRNAQVSGAPLLNHDGRLTGTVGIVLDITERKKAEQALKKSEEKYRNLVENSQDAIAIVSFRGNVLFANKAAERLTGYTLKEGKGLNIRVVTPKKYWPKSVAMLIKARMGKPIPYFDYELKRKDGTIVPVETGGQAIFEDGKPVAIQIITRETTERRKAEETLRESEEKWRSLAENAPNVIVIIDRVGTIQYINHTVVNARPEEIVGKSIYDFVDPEHHNVVKKTIEQVFQTGEGSHYEISGIGPKGSVAWYETHVGPIRRNGQVVSVTLITTDITERKKMEQQLRIKETAVASFINGVAFADLAGKLTYVNRSFLEMWGYANDKEVLGRPAEGFWSSKESAGEVLKALEHNGGWVGDLTAKKKDGSTFEVQLSASLVKDESGRPLCMMSSFMGITERRKAEQTLKESEKKYRDLVELAPDGIVAVNLEGIITSANRSFLKLVGYGSEEEIVGKQFTELTSSRAEDIPKFQVMFMSLLKGESAPPSEFLYVRRDGTSRWAEVHPGLMIKDGHPVGVQAIMRDISERKNTEKLAQESQRNFEGLFIGNPEAAAYLDSDFRIRKINPRFEELFGHSPADVEGKRINEVVVPDDRREEGEALDKEARKGYVYHDTVRRKKDGSLVQVSVSAAPIAVGDKVAGIIAMYHDISDLKNAEKRLDGMNEKLRVVGGLTRHDVRNKLSAITGNIYINKKKLVDRPDVLEGFNDMQSACEQIVRIFEFARDYERLGVEELGFVDVETTVGKAASSFSDLKGVKISNECHGLTVLADSLLERLFYNLIDNSLKHGEKLTQIGIRYEKSENQLKLVYEDDGVGISKDAKTKLFTEGFTTGKGSGYGLYLIRRMMDVYGWTISETGTHGKGAQFTIDIPKAKPDGRQNYRLG